MVAPDVCARKHACMPVYCMCVCIRMCLCLHPPLEGTRMVASLHGRARHRISTCAHACLRTRADGRTDGRTCTHMHVRQSWYMEAKALPSGDWDKASLFEKYLASVISPTAQRHRRPPVCHGCVCHICGMDAVCPRMDGWEMVAYRYNHYFTAACI